MLVFFFFFVWLNAACTASILPVYSMTCSSLLMMPKPGLCGKRPGRVTAACCVSSNITAAFPHRHTCFHFFVCGDGRQGEVPIPPLPPCPSAHASLESKLTDSLWKAILVHKQTNNQKYLNWFWHEACVYMTVSFVLLPHWMVSVMRLLV